MKTIALTMILKNEAHNLEKLCQSVAGCFDQYIFVDTGSTDGTIEFLNFRAKEILGENVIVDHFEWINDFSAARNHALQHVKTDYWFWCDGDDSLSNKNDFMTWKRSTMHIADVWFAPYWYAIDKDRKPIINFVRERVVKTSLGCKFQDFVHEGIRFPENAKASGVMGWHIIHERTEEEMLADKGRNLSLLEGRNDLSPRLKFYLGKERYDNGKPKEASEMLVQALQSEELALGDRILGIQYLCQALYAQGDFVNTIKYALIGINLNPTRAEYHCMVGDSYIGINQIENAIPFYRAALGCQNKANGLTHEFSFGDCYEIHPKKNLAKIYFNMGRFHECMDILKGLNDPEALEIYSMAQQNLSNSDISEADECEDIVITCPMPAAYPWDEDIYKTKGLGGSETAAIEMAKWLKKLTGRCVKIFQEREETFVSESGVEYLPVKHMMTYFKKWKPKVHIAWRHNIKLTNARTFVWCHDLCFEGLKETQNYEKVLALSPFHKDFIKSMLGIPDEKFLITRNGVEPERFKNLKMHKEYGRVIWSNSPDRGLEHAIMIMEKVRESIPGAGLHVFYGLENLKKYGLKDKAEMLEKMISGRPWIKYHGNVEQNVLAEELAKSQVWLYPADFIESFCISALEALGTKAYPVVRNMGALANTLSDAYEMEMCSILQNDPTDYDSYAKEVVEAIEYRKWEDMNIDMDDYSWESVAMEWKKLFDL